MWSDTYCYIDQCGAYKGAVPVGAALFNPEHDNAFAKSIGGMIWPRGFVGAAAFWNYNTSVDPASQAFTQAIDTLTAQLQARGAFVCPPGCACDQLTACGAPYLQPTPLSGDTVGLAACTATYALSTQRWTLQVHTNCLCHYFVFCFFILLDYA